MKDQVERIFSHWRIIHECRRAKLDAKRDRAIRDRLRDGYSEEDLIDAIEGCALSDFHMGQNDRRTKYNDLSLICRDAAHVDRFIEVKETAQRQRARAVEVLQDKSDPEEARRRVIELRNRIKIA